MLYGILEQSYFQTYFVAKPDFSYMKYFGL